MGGWGRAGAGVVLWGSFFSKNSAASSCWHYESFSPVGHYDFFLLVRFFCVLFDIEMHRMVHYMLCCVLHK